MKGKILNKKTLAIAAIAVAAVGLVVGALALFLPSCEGQKTYTGYLICQNCGFAGKCADNNADLTRHPEQYTLKCAKMPECITSGYGMAILQENGKYKYYAFDVNGSELALDNVVYSTKKADNLLVTVRGKMNEDVIEVTAIAEK